MATLRGRCYREDLADLTDSQWLHAVKQARQRRWFPSVEEILRQEGTCGDVRLRVLEPRRTPEQMEADRAEARIGLEMVKAAVASAPAGAFVQVSAPVKSMPPIEATPERLAELRRQADEIVGVGRSG